MASVSRRPNGRWRARFRDADGREHARHFIDEGDAHRWLNGVATSIESGKHFGTADGRITFQAFAEAWRAMRLHRASSAAHVETMLRRHVYPSLGSRRLDSIVHTDIQRWVQTLSEVLAGSTLRVVHGIVSSIFRAAVNDRRVLSNPCDHTRLPQRERRLVVPLRTEQVVRLRDAVPSGLRTLVTVTAGTGMRQGEVFGITRDRLRLGGEDPVVIVDRQLRTLPGPTTAFGPPKTSTSRRIIPLPQVVVEALDHHIRLHDVADDGLIFTLGGQPITRQAFGHLWRPAAKTAGLNALTGTGMHALRHYYASLLIRYGESAKTVQARLGHSSPSETLETYAHLWHDSNDRTRLAVDTELRL
ncbi:MULTISPECIES: tyrosine-type recombinase/integrase [unclassified Nocardioides]|uniref:tyrosine-type recombinase/integrase n=1 Tax=unclassified Nocardioides TaxID=2615069 RepID=UPI0030153916